MVEKLKVKNWEKHQHYKDRSPPWIKLHGSLLSDYEFTCLQDASKLHLIAIWLLARETNGVIPNDPRWVKKCAGLDGEIDLKPLIESGFLVPLQDASKLLASCSPEERREEERRDRGEESEIHPTDETASKLAMEFHFRIPGTSKPIISDLTAEFQAKLDWLKAQGRNETEHILACIKDPKRDRTEAKTIGSMWRFWKYCGLEETKHAINRKSDTAPGGGRYEGIEAPIV